MAASTSKQTCTLFVVVIIFLIFVIDLEVPEFVISVRAGHNTKPITEVVLLQVFLGEIFQIPLRQRSVSNNSHLVLHCFQINLFKVVEFPFNLDAALKKFFEVINLHDTIFNWMSAVNVEGQCRLLLGCLL